MGLWENWFDKLIQSTFFWVSSRVKMEWACCPAGLLIHPAFPTSHRIFLHLCCVMCTGGQSRTWECGYWDPKPSGTYGGLLSPCLPAPGQLAQAARQRCSTGGCGLCPCCICCCRQPNLQIQRRGLPWENTWCSHTIRHTGFPYMKKIADLKWNKIQFLKNRVKGNPMNSAKTNFIKILLFINIIFFFYFRVVFFP